MPGNSGRSERYGKEQEKKKSKFYLELMSAQLSPF